MRKQLIFVFVYLLVNAAQPAFSNDEPVLIRDPWSRASVGTRTPGVAYMTIKNTSNESLTLVGIETKIAEKSTIHNTTVDKNGISSMSSVKEIQIKSGEEVFLQPGGLHAMLVNLQEPLIKGQSYQLTLIFDNGFQKSVDVPVFSISYTGNQ